MTRIEELRALAERQRGGKETEALAATLVELAEATPAFSAHAASSASNLEDEAVFGSKVPESPIPLEVRRATCLARAYVALGRTGEAVSVGRRAVVLAVECGDKPLELRARVQLGVVLASTGGSPQEALEIASAAEPLAADLDLSQSRLVRALAKVVTADVLFNQEDVSRARDAYEEAIQLLKPLDDFMDAERYHVLVALSALHQAEENRVRALTRLDHALRIALKQGLVQEELECRFPMANLLTGFGRYEEAQPHLDRTVEISRKEPALGHWLVSLLVLRSLNLMCLRRLDEALKSAEDAHREAFELGDAMGYVQACGALQGVHMAMENPEGAYRVLAYGAATLQTVGKPDAAELVRAMIQDLRSRVGPEAFDEMAERMAHEQRLKRKLRGDPAVATPPATEGKAD